MADKTGIEWTDATWNPVVGCSLVSPGCTHCYAMHMAARIERMHAGSHYAGTTRTVNGNAVWTGKLALAPERIVTQPLRWTKPRRVFVNSMSDLFHEDASDTWIDRAFAVMAASPQHTFQVLTKRSGRMRVWMKEREDWRHDRSGHGARLMHDWPLPNVWLGVSAEDQRRADERIPDLLDAPAAVRFVSAEPLVGRIDFSRWTTDPAQFLDYCDAVGGPPATVRMLDWIIVGGESGPNARPMHPDWVRAIRDQCAAAGVAFFFKQWGEWLDEQDATARHMAPGPDMFDRFGAPKGSRWHPYEASDRNGGAMIRVGKRRAGRLLDGRTHDGLPCRS